MFHSIQWQKRQKDSKSIVFKLLHEKYDKLYEKLHQVSTRQNLSTPTKALQNAQGIFFLKDAEWADIF